ncbi:sigma-E processing peptidase SpoIIGA [Sporosarcina aquimarina]|uniref:Sigma-E processing peptidase SpoIIGA n=1 Tax=Sporosarcina aquimarina TaxID=114975 RepID=A0ABU4FX83_9BACL|nr:sigma-E processing peptidase SpoIIGA [Sporosarcina aquimarina]MDW0109305.1 sigma-E processing peptidase SpoIIGA [Sporosarcina aquimarina]
MYGEVMIGINMVFNYTVLSFANTTGNAKIGKKQLVLAAFAGAIPAVVFPGSLTASFIAFAFMTVCAFGFSAHRWKASGVLVLIGAFLAGGLLSALPFTQWGQDFKFRLLFYAVLAYGCLQLVKVKWLDVRKISRFSEFACSSELVLFGTSVKLQVFIDTGNSCTEPLSNDAVHFVSLKAVKPILPEELLSCLEAAEVSQTAIPDLSKFPEKFRKKLRLIRIQTVEGANWAVGIRFDDWKLEGKHSLEKGYIVLTADNARYPHSASAILHVSALETKEEERGLLHAT